ncbi:plasmid replication protein RepC [Rhizobium oryzicola]|uniref:Plasmid replication protein RepC n=2 Tax=Rhizobium oryzicola TaxID=1232668 RepID=A0ABT8T562_9HYPH|nr:plasmid replication protein RepC [Rhizobium oryzicola]
MGEPTQHKRPTGRRMTKERAEFRRLAQSTEIGTVTRGQLAVLARNLMTIGMVTTAEYALLEAIITTAKADAFDKGGRPIVYKSNRQLAYDINKSPGRVSRILSRLYDLGLVTMQDSANFKRYPIRDGEGDIADACGIDLRVLIARHHELDQLVRQKREEIRVRDSAARRFRDALRAARYALASSTERGEAILGRIGARVEKIAAFIGSAKHAPAHVLRKATMLLEWLADRLRNVNRSPQAPDIDANLTCADVENDMHIQITTPRPFEARNDERRSPNGEQISSLRAGSASKRAFEESLGSRSRQSNRQLQVRPSLVALEDVWRATPSLAEYGYQPPRSWADLDRIAPKLCRIAGVSEDARQRAVERMGQQAAAVAIALTFEKYTRAEISSPGGYLRAMTDRAAIGELHLNRSVFGLAARNSMEARA